MATPRKYTGPKAKAPSAAKASPATKKRAAPALLNAMREQKPAFTQNGGLTLSTSLDACVDLHFIMGASRGKDIAKQFLAAYGEDPVTATRQLLYLRDAREGVGERQQFRTLFQLLARENQAFAARVTARLPELGRWDDVVAVAEYAFDNDREMLFNVALDLIRLGLGLGEAKTDALCAKWMPRKGKMSRILREGLELSPRQYRKTLVKNTNVVETLMCAQNWSEIDFEKLPSVAAARYQKAFERHDIKGKYTDYVKAVVAGTAKVNAGAIFPHDVLKSLRRGNKDIANAQWKALPDFTRGSNESVMPVVDVSGSMGCSIGAGETTAMEVALGMGLYLSERLKGPFQDTFMTFSSSPEMLHLTGTLQSRLQQMETSRWGMSTNIEAVFTKILSTAQKAGLGQEDLPAKVLVLSDMEFNSCVEGARGGTLVTAFNKIRQHYKNAGYEMPQLVFWNINARGGNVPVKYDQAGTALVSGYSPAVVTSVLGGGVLSPVEVMAKAISSDRYNF